MNAPRFDDLWGEQCFKLDGEVLKDGEIVNATLPSGYIHYGVALQVEYVRGGVMGHGMGSSSYCSAHVPIPGVGLVSLKSEGLLLRRAPKKEPLHTYRRQEKG